MLTRSSAGVLAAAGAITATTAAVRTDAVPLRLLAASPQAVADGRVWLLATSALVADRPAVASVLGFVLVGLATQRLCGGRTAWIAAASGHVVSAAVVYLALAFVRALDPTAFERVLALPDFGTSAIVAAWLGAIAYRLWTRRARAAAVALCLAAGAIGWLCKGSLTVLATEHVVALALGVAVVRAAGREREAGSRAASAERLASRSSAHLRRWSRACSQPSSVDR